MSEELLYFTELLGMPVLDIRGRRIGKVRDAAVVPLVNASRIDRVLVGGESSWLTVRYDQIQTISLDRGIALADEQLVPYHDDEYMLRIRRDLGDRAYVGLMGTNVTRAEDTASYPVAAPGQVLCPLSAQRLALPLALWILAYVVTLIHFVPQVRDKAMQMSEMRSVVTGRIVDSYTNIQTVKLFAHPEREDAHVLEA